MDDVERGEMANLDPETPPGPQPPPTPTKESPQELSGGVGGGSNFSSEAKRAFREFFLFCYTYIINSKKSTERLLLEINKRD